MSALNLRNYYTYQWFAQKIMPFILIFFYFWIRATEVRHNTFMAAYSQSWSLVLVISLAFEVCTEILIHIIHIVLQRFEVVLFEPRMQFAFRSFTITSSITFSEVTLIGSAVTTIFFAFRLMIVYEL